MLDDDLGRRLKGAALPPPSDLDMRTVRRRARSLGWIRAGMAVGVVVVLVAVGAGVVTRWPGAQKSRLAFGPARHTPNILPRDWTLTARPGLKHRLSRQQAATIGVGGPSSSHAKVVRVAFGLFTDHAAHHVGSGKLDYHNIPAWVVTLKGVPVCFYGPQAGPCKVGASFIVIRDRDGKRLMESQVVSPPGTEQTLAGATLGVYSPGKTVNQAALNGTLVLNGGCVMVQPNGNVQPIMIAWVPGFHTEAGMGGVRVADEHGATVASIGDKVRFGGGPISSSDVRTASGNALPQSCATDHLFAMYTIRRLNQEIVVPDVIGMQIDKAAKMLKAAGLKPGLTTTKLCGRRAFGCPVLVVARSKVVVIKQRPKVGTTVKLHSQVKMVAGLRKNLT